jgi:hypothetical protein
VGYSGGAGWNIELAQPSAYVAADPLPIMYASLPNLRRTWAGNCPDTGV